MFTGQPGNTDTITVWRNGAAAQIEARWGLKPFEPGGKPISLLRAERWQGSNPCLIIATNFALRVDGQIKYRAQLITDARFFCIAGVWRAATPDWPLSFAALTVPAYPDIQPFKDRHVAIVRQEDWQAWLTGALPMERLMRPFPKGSFAVRGNGRRIQTQREPEPALGDLFA